MITRRSFIRTAGWAAALGTVRSSHATHQLNQGPVSILALVGCAHIHTPVYIRELAARTDARVKYVWDHEEARASKSADPLNAKTSSDLTEIWSDQEVIGVVICSETNRHYDLVLAAAEAGKHMFVEKPFATTAREGFEMAAAIEKNNLLFTTGYPLRASSANLFLKSQLDQGNLGKITRISAYFTHHGALEGWFDNEWDWMADPSIAGVGAFGDVGTHALDIVMWLMGDVESVTADIKKVTGRFGECDESGEGMIRFSSGVTGTVAGGWVDFANPVALMISGTEGHAMIVNDRLFFECKNVTGADGTSPWRSLPRGGGPPLGTWIDAVGGDPSFPLVSAREAADRVSVMEAMYQAVRDRQWTKPRRYRA